FGDEFGSAAVQVGRVHKSIKFAVRKRFHFSTTKYTKHTKGTLKFKLTGFVILNHSQFAAFSSARVFKRKAPKSVAASGERDERILQFGREQEALQPLRPAVPAGKLFIAGAGDFLPGGGPGNFSGTPRGERRDSEFRRLEGHGHAVASDGWNHGDGVAKANFVTFAGTLRAQRNSGNGTKGRFI